VLEVAAGEDEVGVEVEDEDNVGVEEALELPFVETTPPWTSAGVVLF
jgi:hypothetical protein